MPVARQSHVSWFSDRGSTADGSAAVVTSTALHEQLTYLDSCFDEAPEYEKDDYGSTIAPDSDEESLADFPLTDNDNNDDVTLAGGVSPPGGNEHHVNSGIACAAM